MTTRSSVAAAPALGLPPRLKVLYVAARAGAGAWLAQAFAADGATHIVLEEVLGAQAALARVRDEAFDAILASHEPPTLDAVELVAAFRAGGGEEPFLILGNDPPQLIDAVCYEAGADDYSCVAEATVRGLLWKFARALRRFALVRENRRLVEGERQRLRQEHHEAERLLAEQRRLLADLRTLTDDEVETPENLPLRAATRRDPRCGDHARLELPAELAHHYRELLRAYVIMGAGNLSREMTALAELLVASGVSAEQAIELHVGVLENLVSSLGNRSARHVMNRADLLALEVLGHLADGYRRRYHERRLPPRQQLLPGFDSAAAAAPPPTVPRAAA